MGIANPLHKAESDVEKVGNIVNEECIGLRPHVVFVRHLNHLDILSARGALRGPNGLLNTLIPK